MRMNNLPGHHCLDHFILATFSFESPQVAGGDQPGHSPVAQHRISVELEPAYNVQRFGDRDVGRQRNYILSHHRRRGHARQDISVGSIAEVYAVLEQEGFVDRKRCETRSYRVRNRVGDHQRQDDLVVVSHFEYQQDRRYRHANHRREHRAHSYKGKPTARYRCVRLQIHKRVPHPDAEHRADEQRRSKHASRHSRSIAERRRKDLGDHQRQHGLEHKLIFSP